MASTKIALIVSLTIFIAFSGKNITNYCRTAVKINRPVTNILNGPISNRHLIQYVA